MSLHTAHYFAFLFSINVSCSLNEDRHWLLAHSTHIAVKSSCSYPMWLGQMLLAQVFHSEQFIVTRLSCNTSNTAVISPKDSKHSTKTPLLNIMQSI